MQIGKWYGFECTVCKINREVPCSNNGIPQWKYCPDCGAEMRSEDIMDEQDTIVEAEDEP